MAMRGDQAGGQQPPGATDGGDTGGAPIEVELKLACDAGSLTALAESDAVRANARNRGTSRVMESVYYDTGDRRLSRRGAALRVRRVGRRHIQTLKGQEAANLGGLTQRGEWEWPVANLSPDLAAVIEGDARSILGALDARDLTPLFATNIRRRTFLLDTGDATIELALDQGKVEAGDRSAQIVEIELELKAGRTEAIYDLALRLADVAPLWLEPRSKAERGYALADAATVAAIKRDLDPPPDGASVDDALSVFLGECLSHLTRNVPAVIDGRDPEGIHQARVALRRLRSCLGLFRQPLPDDARQRLNRAAKTVADALGPARDLDVLIGEVLPVIATDLDGASLVPLVDAAQRARAVAHEAARATIAAPGTTRLALEIGRWIASRGWRDQPYSVDAALLDHPLAEIGDPLLQRRYRRLIKKGRHFEHLTMAERHEVRLEAKKLRYAMEFLAHNYKPKRVAPFDRALKRLQSALGRHQDNATARALVERLGHGGGVELVHAAGLAEGWLARDVASDEKNLIARWRAFAQARPFWHSGA